jgi:hypothetical protein
VSVEADRGFARELWQVVVGGKEDQYQKNVTITPAGPGLVYDLENDGSYLVLANIKNVLEGVQLAIAAAEEPDDYALLVPRRSRAQGRRATNNQIENCYPQQSCHALFWPWELQRIDSDKNHGHFGLLQRIPGCHRENISEVDKERLSIRLPKRSAGKR